MEELVVRVKVDPSDLVRMSGGSPLGGSGGSSSSSAASGASGGGEGDDGVKVKIGSASSSFQSLLKPLLLLEAVNKSIGFLVHGSSVANTYLGAMGKMFGAAIDLLLLPFLPLFNLLLIGVSKLVEFLTQDDVQKWLSKLSDDLMKELTDVWNIGKDIYGIISGLLHGDLDQVWSSIKDLGGDIKAFWDDGSPIAKILVAILGALTVRTALGAANWLTGGLAGKAAGGLGGVLFGGGGGAAGTGATGVGGGATAAAGGGSMLGAIIPPVAVATAGVLAMWQVNKLVDKYDPLGLGSKRPDGWDNNGDFFGQLRAQQASGGSSGTAPNVGTQNNTININGAQSPTDVAKAVRDELEKYGRGIAGR